MEYKVGHTVAADDISFSDVVRALFKGALKRDIAPSDLSAFVAGLKGGFPLDRMVSDIISSDEFSVIQSSPLVVKLPNLIETYPEMFFRDKNSNIIYRGRSKEDIDFLEDAIRKYRYYDSFGIWTPEVNIDKKVTASIIASLHIKSCLEIGCYSGSVLNLLDKDGIDICGVELSHRGHLLAEQDIHQKIRYGDLLELDFERTYDSFLAMDVLEHLNPSKFDRYIKKIASLLSPDGTAYINSPMFGSDRVFQQVFGCYVDEWINVGDTANWYHIHCDEKGWPVHGHLVWASPAWWESAFERHGLVRDVEAEIVVQTILANFFLRHAPARKSLFILRHKGASSIDAVGLRSRLLDRVANLLYDEGLEYF